MPTSVGEGPALSAALLPRQPSTSRQARTMCLGYVCLLGTCMRVVSPHWNRVCTIQLASNHIYRCPLLTHTMGRCGSKRPGQDIIWQMKVLTSWLHPSKWIHVMKQTTPHTFTLYLVLHKIERENQHCLKQHLVEILSRLRFVRLTKKKFRTFWFLTFFSLHNKMVGNYTRSKIDCMVASFCTTSLTYNT